MNLFPVGFLEFGLKDFIETLIIAGILFYLYKKVRGGFAITAFIGLVIIFVLNIIVSALGLNTINFFLRKITDVGVLAVIIIFQPDIRRLLYTLGSNNPFNPSRYFSQSQSGEIIDEVIEAVKSLTRTKTGALIVFARGSSLQDLIDNGVRLESKVKAELITTIFNKNTPLHDGAIIIKGDRLIAASCYLPISQNPNISKVFGTRHRAALGVSESNNVFVLVVSEETGRISIARNGALTSGLTVQKLRQEMEENLKVQTTSANEGFTAANAELEMN